MDVPKRSDVILPTHHLLGVRLGDLRSGTTTATLDFPALAQESPGLRIGNVKLDLVLTTVRRRQHHRPCVTVCDFVSAQVGYELLDYPLSHAFFPSIE